MIFIWSSRDGPLQYVGLVIFALQMLPYLTAELNAFYLFQVGLGFLAGALAYSAYIGSPGTAASRVLAPFREAWEWIQRTRSGMGNDGLVILLSGVALFVVFAFAKLFGNEVAWAAIHLLALFFIAKEQMQGRDRGHEEQTNEKKMSEIVKTIQVMPIEEFVKESNMTAECSVLQLKRMLKNRGKNADNFVERRDLEDAVKECRNYNETCCICCEDYDNGDLLRVLPSCLHEFHVECVDQWAYTFANNAKREREPTCPLCNVPLK